MTRVGEVYDNKEIARELLDKGVTNFIVSPFGKDGNPLPSGEIVIQFNNFSPYKFLGKLEEEVSKIIDEPKKSRDTLMRFLASELTRHTGNKINMLKYLGKEDSKIEILGEFRNFLKDLRWV